MEDIPEYIKKDMDIMRKKIELLKNSDSEELRKKVIFGKSTVIIGDKKNPIIFDDPIITDFGKALLACIGKSNHNWSYMDFKDLQTYFESYSEYESWMQRNNLEIEGNALKNKISFNQIKRADAKLYEGKENGRNQVVW